MKQKWASKRSNIYRYSNIQNRFQSENSKPYYLNNLDIRIIQIHGFEFESKFRFGSEFGFGFKSMFKKKENIDVFNEF